MGGGDAESGRAQGRDEVKNQPTSRGAPPPRAGEFGAAAPRAGDGGRRRRSPERRPAGWGDGVERFACARDGDRLPSTFPVESRTGVATIPATVVARRAGALLLCRFTHGGPHQWPDGEEGGDGLEA